MKLALKLELVVALAPPRVSVLVALTIRLILPAKSGLVVRRPRPSRLLSSQWPERVAATTPKGWLELSKRTSSRLGPPLASSRKVSCSESGSALLTPKESLSRNTPPSRTWGELFSREISGDDASLFTARLRVWELDALARLLSLAPINRLFASRPTLLPLMTPLAASNCQPWGKALPSACNTLSWIRSAGL